MNKMIVGLLALAMTVLIGCASGTITEPSACDSDSLSFPLPSTLSNLPPAIVVDAGAFLGSVDAGGLLELPPVIQTKSLDFSSTLQKITDITSDVTVGLNSLTLDNSQGQFDWLQTVSVTMQGTTSNTPSIPLATYMSTGTPGAEINLMSSVLASPDQMLAYFESGQVTLTITLGGAKGTPISQSTLNMLLTLNGTLSTNLAVCISASASLSKSL